MARILIVEDDVSVARILAAHLQKRGHTPFVASDGRSALHAAGARPALILLDLGLPDIPGEEILRHFGRDATTAGIPVVVLSGKAAAAAVVRQSGVDTVAAILLKPVSGADIGRVVDGVLSMRAVWAVAAAGSPSERQRVKLILRLILEGSMPLLLQICRLLEVERSDRQTEGSEAPRWADIARRARRESLVNGNEAQVLFSVDAARLNQ